MKKKPGKKKRKPAKPKAPVLSPRPVGRPSEYCLEVGIAICARLADGESLRSICKDDSLPDKRTIFRWLDAHKEFSHQYARAREIQAEGYAEEIVEIADTPQMGVKTVDKPTGIETTSGDMIEHRKLQIDARKWVASKLLPKKYGNKDSDTGSRDRLDEVLAAFRAGGQPRGSVNP